MRKTINKCFAYDEFKNAPHFQSYTPRVMRKSLQEKNRDRDAKKVDTIINRAHNNDSNKINNYL